jgi:hypothetical protein
VAIGGIGALRFVVVTPVAGTTGSAVVTLSVRPPHYPLDARLALNLNPETDARRGNLESREPPNSLFSSAR